MQKFYDKEVQSAQKFDLGKVELGLGDQRKSPGGNDTWVRSERMLNRN